MEPRFGPRRTTLFALVLAASAATPGRAEVAFTETGVVLEISPRVTDGGRVELDIRPAPPVELTFGASVGAASVSGETVPVGRAVIEGRAALTEIVLPGGSAIELGAVFGGEADRFDELEAQWGYWGFYVTSDAVLVSFGRTPTAGASFARPNATSGLPALANGTESAVTNAFTTLYPITGEERRLTTNLLVRPHFFGSSVVMLSYTDFPDLDVDVVEIGLRLFGPDWVFDVLGEHVSTASGTEWGYFANATYTFSNSPVRPSINISGGRSALTAFAGGDPFFSLGLQLSPTDRLTLGAQIADYGAVGDGQGIYADYRISDGASVRAGYNDLGNDSIIYVSFIAEIPILGDFGRPRSGGKTELIEFIRPTLVSGYK